MVSSVETPQSLHCQNLGSPANLKKKTLGERRGFGCDAVWGENNNDREREGDSEVGV